MSHWRETAARVIRETLAKLPDGASEKEKRAALYNAYPFGLGRCTPIRFGATKSTFSLATVHRRTSARRSRA